MASIRKFQETNHETSRKTDYPSLHEIIKIEDEVRTALKSLKDKKERFREWTKSLGDSPKIVVMFQDFDARITQLAAKLEYLEKIRTQVARGEIAPNEISLYVARAKSDFVLTPESEIAPGEEDSTAREVSARKDDFPETESPEQIRQQELESVPATPQMPAIEISPETGSPNPVEAMKRSDSPESQIPSAPPEMVSEQPADLPADEPAAGELFETILEEQPTPEEIADEAVPEVTEFMFVIEDTDAPPEKPESIRTESVAPAPEEQPETVSEPAGEISTQEPVVIEPEAIPGATLPEIPEVTAKPVEEIAATPETGTTESVTPAPGEQPETVSEPAGEISTQEPVVIESEAIPGATLPEIPEVTAKPVEEIAATPETKTTESVTPAPGEQPETVSEPAGESSTPEPVIIEPVAIPGATLPEIPEVTAKPVEEIAAPSETGTTEWVTPAPGEQPEAISEPAGEISTQEPVVIEPEAIPGAMLPVDESQVAAKEASADRTSTIQPEIAEKAIDSIFTRNMVLKKRSKILKGDAEESASEGDADAITDSSDATPGETSVEAHRGWKKVAQSIPEADLAELIEEVHREEQQATVGDETIPAPADAATKSPPEEKPFSKYIQPKLPEKLLKKQYHHYLAERNIPIPPEEADLANLDLDAFDSEDSPQPDGKREKLFSYKNIKSRFSFRRFKKSKEDKQTMETGKAATPKEIKTESVVKEEISEVKAQAEPEKTEVAEDKSVLYLGIDLGTSETTIAASNGVVATVLSVMGRPKDFISQKLLKADKLFGIDALRNKLAVTLYRPMEKGVIKDTEADLEAARELVKYVISLASPEKYQKVYAVIGAPARSSFANQQALVDAAREVVDAVMIVSEPFAVAYGEGKIYNSLVIDIGAGTTDICCLKGSMPEEEDQFTLLKAGDFIDNHLVDLVSSKFEGAQVTKDLAKKFKEEFSFVLEPDRNAVVEITVQGKPTKIDITKDIREACESIIPEMITCTKNIIANFNPEFQGELKENILLAGGGSLIKNLGQYIERQLRALGTVKVSLVPNPIEAGAKGALALAKDLTDEYWRAL